MPAKKVITEQMPKACEEFKQMLLKLGKLTPEGVGSKEHSAIRNKATTALRTGLGKQLPEKLAEYDGLASDKQRAEFLCEYLIDASTGGCVGKNFTERNMISNDINTSELYTLAQLAGPLCFNDLDMAKTYSKKKPKQVHPDPDMAGIEFWHYTRHQVVNNNQLKQGARVEVGKDLTASEYESVAAHMANPKNPGDGAPAHVVKGKQNKKRGAAEMEHGAPPLSTDELTRRSSVEAAQKLIKEMKATFDKVAKDLTAVSAVEASLRMKKWDSKSQILFLQKETDKVKHVNNALLDGWTKYGVELSHIVETTPFNQLRCDNLMSSGEELKQAALNVYKTFAREVLADIVGKK